MLTCMGSVMAFEADLHDLGDDLKGESLALYVECAVKISTLHHAT